jgi:amino acid transporter
MVNYSLLDVGDPLAFVFAKLDLKWMSGIIAVSAVIAMASVLGFQMGQPRIWMSMSRDGLLPKKFSSTPKIQNTILCNSNRICGSCSCLVLEPNNGDRFM